MVVVPLSASENVGPSSAGQSSKPIMKELRKIESSLTSTITSVSDHVDRLSESVYRAVARDVTNHVTTGSGVQLAVSYRDSLRGYRLFHESRA